MLSSLVVLVHKELADIDINKWCWNRDVKWLNTACHLRWWYKRRQWRCDMKAGSSSAGVSGEMKLTTGEATGGNGGAITLSVGAGDIGTGGAMSLSAGETKATNAQGGSMTLTGGSSTHGTVGSVVV